MRNELGSRWRFAVAILFLHLSLTTVVSGEEKKMITNSIGMTLVEIPAGSFLMGSEQGGDFDERPVHKVTITKPFCMGATEVTNAQYELFDPEHKALRGKLGFSKADDEAVVFVTWHDAVRFCEWLSKKEGKPYRLPTEAEWEYACRAGTTTAYHTGDDLPKAFHKNVRNSWFPGPRAAKAEVVPLTVAKTPANAWGLHDMHGNVEEWCWDWYGPYTEGEQTDPVGCVDGDFRATRGGSHSTLLEYLRSANRLGTLPEDKSWLIGFRVVLGEMPGTHPLPCPASPLNQQNVRQDIPPDLDKGPDPEKPYFKGPRTYVKIPPNSEGPLFSKHNHCPAIVNCPNGDMLAIWYTCRTEPGRELGICASRLPYGSEEWQPASPLWDVPDRNDHASALYLDEHGMLYHFNGLSAAGTWGSLATIMRTSTDSGATWSKARLIMPEHGVHHMPIESVFKLQDGTLLVPCDAVPGGSGGSAVLLGKDGGKTWRDPGEGKPDPDFKEGSTGAWIAGIHAGVVQLKDERLMAFGRGNDINGRMPISISDDGGETWTYSASEFPPLTGGQRLVVLRLKEGPIFFASFAKRLTVEDATGAKRNVSGLFGALSFDEGRTWPVKRLITDDKPGRPMDGGGNTHAFTMSECTAEPRGYMSVCQTPDGLIHLISSKLHDVFNLAWLKAPMPKGPSLPLPPKAKTLPVKGPLDRVFTPGDPPSKSPSWRFTGSGAAEADLASIPEPGRLKIDTGAGQRCRWLDDSADGFGKVDAAKGYTAEIQMQVLKSTDRRRGVDFETYIGDGQLHAARCFITVSRDAVYWHGEEREALVKKLDNHSAMHTYRLSVRPDGIVQIYRDAKLLGVRRPLQTYDGLSKAKGPYLQWGEGAGASEADALVAHVAYDLSGAYQPQAEGDAGQGKKTKSGTPVRSMWGCPMPQPDKEGAGFPILANAKHAMIYRATRETGAYSHHSQLIRHDGTFYAAWSNHPHGEDGPGQRVLYATSPNAADWSEFRELFPPPGEVKPSEETGVALTAGRWVELDGRLYATAQCHENVGFRNVDDTSVRSARDKRHPYRQRERRSRLGREVRADGSLGPIFALGKNLPKEFAFDVTLHDDASIADVAARVRKAIRSRPRGLPRAVEGHPLCEPTAYRARDGKWVMLLRDDTYSHRMFVSVFDEDAGEWPPAQPTDIPDSPSKSDTLVLDDGTVLLIGNQMAPAFDNASEVKHYGRDPLMVSVSRDGYSFDRAFALRCGQQKFRIPRREVLGRGGGAQYPDAIVHDGTLYVLYSVGKEDVAVSWVPLTDLGL